MIERLQRRIAAALAPPASTLPST